MALRIHLKKGITARSTEWALFDSKADRIYQRIRGGIILQGPRGSAAAVVAEGAVLRPPPPMFLVGMATATDAGGIIARANELMVDLHSDDWYNDYSDTAGLRFLDQFNNKAREIRAKPLYVNKVAHADAGLAYFLNTLKGALVPGKRVLHLEEFEGEVNSALAAISSTEITSAKFEDHPLVAALAMAVASLMYSSYTYGQQRQERALTEYDLFGSQKKRTEDYGGLQERALTETDVFNPYK